jgi:iron(III) transport system substrate-binding protein
MVVHSLRNILTFITAATWLGVSTCLAASVGSALQAKQEAEPKGYIFETSRDEIIAKAKKEGMLRVLSVSRALKLLLPAFKAQYPFLNVEGTEQQGTETHERFILELKAGRIKDWDVTHLGSEFYNEYLPYLKQFDIFGMANRGVLRISPQVVDPTNRNIISANTQVQVIVYNKELVAPEKAPATWEDFLKPEYKGNKFAADIRPTEIAALVPVWGLEKTLDFSRKIAAQQPIWIRGATRTIVSVSLGEVPIFIGANLGSVMRAMDTDRTKSLGYKVVEPVPVRLSDTEAVLASAKHPYAALLWLEFRVSRRGQEILDKIDTGSVLLPGSAHEKMVQGKKLSLVDWEHMPKLPDYQRNVVEAYGFPKAQK